MSKATKQHFELIARVLRDAKENSHATTADEQARVTAVLMADALDTTNPNFNRARFLKACGLEG